MTTSNRYNLYDKLMASVVLSGRKEREDNYLHIPSDI